MAKQTEKITVEIVKSELWRGGLSFNDIASLEHNHPKVLAEARKAIREYMNSSSCK